MQNRVILVLIIVYVSVTAYCLASPTEIIGELIYIKENDVWYVQGEGGQDKVLGEYIIVKYKNSTKEQGIKQYNKLNNLSIKKRRENGWCSLYIPKNEDPIEIIKKY